MILVMLVAPKHGALRPLLGLAHAHAFYYDSIMVRASQAQKPLTPTVSTEIAPMETPQEMIFHSQEAIQLLRSFSFELESRRTEELPQNELTLAVVEERVRGDEREKKLSKLRKHFEPCPISEY